MMRPPGCPIDRHGADEDFLEKLDCFNCPINPYFCDHKMVVIANEELPTQILEYDGIDEIEAMMPPINYRCYKCGKAYTRNQVLMVDGATGEPFNPGESPNGKTARFICRKCLSGKGGENTAGYQ